MRKDAQFGNRKQDLGIGLLPWGEHVKSLQVNWLLRYMDATRGEWKLLLDAWLARGHEDRGTMFTTVGVKSLTGQSMAVRWTDNSTAEELGARRGLGDCEHLERAVHR